MKLCLSALILTAVTTGAVTLERSKLGPDASITTIQVSHLPSLEPAAALRIRIYLKPNLAIRNLVLRPGTEGIWSQLVPELNRNGSVLEVTAISPTHTDLSHAGGLTIFSLDVGFETAPGAYQDPIDSARILEAYDAWLKPLRLDIRDSLASSGVLRPASRGVPVSMRSIGQSHTLSFFLAKSLEVRGRLLDAFGKPIRVLAQGRYLPGRHSLVWNGLNAAGALQPAGIYFLELRIGPDTHHKKVGHFP